jgi:CheY-like chemotaxis protein
MAGRRILIVDDAAEARGILAIALRTIPGASVAEADSGERALELLDAEPADVLVTDVRMAGMDGFELLAALRARNRWPARGALVISGEQNALELRQRALDCGAAEFFAKPFSAAAVRKFVSSLLDSYGVE